jgi:hypothetical protein
MEYLRLADGIVHVGGVVGGDTVTGTRQKLEKSCMPRGEILGMGRPYNCGHGKRAERQQDGGVARSSDEGE